MPVILCSCLQVERLAELTTKVLILLQKCSLFPDPKQNYIFFLIPWYLIVTHINSSPSSAAYMRRWTGPAFVQVMACHLFGAKPLVKQVLTYGQLDPWEQTLVKFESKYKSENSFQNVVCGMAAIFLSSGRWLKVKRLNYQRPHMTSHDSFMTKGSASNIIAVQKQIEANVLNINREVPSV